MLEISIILDSDGVLHTLNLNGHLPGAPQGENLACAAVSLTVRSAARLVAGCPRISVRGAAPEPGRLFLRVINRPVKETQWLKGITDLLLQALADIDDEYPGAMSINIEEKKYGS